VRAGHLLSLHPDRDHLRNGRGGAAKARGAVCCLAASLFLLAPCFGVWLRGELLGAAERARARRLLGPLRVLADFFFLFLIVKKENEEK
jgi:hypothetical protein